MPNIELQIPIIRLTDRKVFVRTVMDVLPEFPTLQDAFYAVNDVFEEHAGKPRYADFGSFRVAKHREKK